MQVTAARARVHHRAQRARLSRPLSGNALDAATKKFPEPGSTLKLRRTSTTVKIAMFYHSLLSDWNHGNAHFLRGVVWELKQRGHEVRVFEPSDAWSLTHLLDQYGSQPIAQFHRAYPGLKSIRYRLDDLDLAHVLTGVDLVLVHEWNDHELVRRIGSHRLETAGYHLLFHDSHHRALTDPASMTAYDRSGYDGVLA